MCIRESKMKAKFLWDKYTFKKVCNRFIKSWIWKFVAYGGKEME